MKHISSPHDKFFKEVFSNKAVATDLLNHYMPDELREHFDLSDVKIAKESFVEEAQKEYFADLLYLVKLNDKKSYIYILFEHKSSPDADTALQLLCYMCRIWMLHRKQHKKGKLPPVLPVVIYHGKIKWRFGKRLMNIVDVYDKIVVKYLCDFPYFFIDLAGLPDKKIRGGGLLKTAFCFSKIQEPKH
mgnify:FL=1